MRAVFILLILIYIASVSEAQSPQSTGTDGNHVVCYYTYWSSVRKSPYDFQPEDIDPFLCTHIIYAFAIGGDHLDFDTTQGNFTDLQPRVIKLKQTNPQLKVMLTVGGWREGPKAFADISKNQENRMKFSQYVVKFLRDYDFDGMDLNWQHPTFREGGKPVDKENYVFLAQNLREEFERDATETGRPRLILSISITQLKKALVGYDIHGFNNYMDFISVLCYDYVFSYTEIVKHHAPLYALPGSSEEDKTLNIDSTIDYFLEQADPGKLVLGIPTYGRTKKLVDSKDTDLEAEADGPGEAGPGTGEKGFLAYFEICSKVKNESWTVAHTKPYGSVGPHAFKGDQWVGYDDAEMVRTKALYAKRRGLAGVVFWTIDYDDFRANCGKRRFPLINAAKDVLNMKDAKGDTEMIFPTEPTRATVKPTTLRPKLRAITKPSTIRPATPRGVTPQKTRDIITAKDSTAQSPQPADGNNVVCYYTYWSSGRKPPYDFQPEDVDPFLCTHIIYAFALGGENLDFDTSQGNFTDLQPRLIKLKQTNPQLKVMLTVGGWREGPKAFADISKNQENRMKFSQYVVKFLRDYDFDGMDLNWQHPTFREGGKPEDKENYVFLAQSLREEFERDAVETGRPRLILSISITQLKKALVGYDIHGFNNYVDFISVLCYDYVFSYTDTVKHHAPLYALPNSSEEDKTLNIDYTINYFLEQADANKLVLGIPTYGRTKTLVDPEDTELGATADGPGEAGPGTGEKGFLAYFEICSKIKNESWKVAYTKPYGSVGPHAFKGDQWVGYDDAEMVRTKARYAKRRGLAGVVFWTIDYDDFRATCGRRRFPLINAAKDVLNMKDYRKETGVVFPTEPSRATVQPATLRPKPRPRTTTPLAPEPTAPETESPQEIMDYLLNTPKVVATRPPSPKHDLLYSPTLINPEVNDPRYDEPVDVEQQQNLVNELIQLIERAGGMRNFCRILRAAKTSFKRTRGSMRRSDDMIVDVPNLEPFRLLISNSSITIQELNVYGAS